MTDADLIPTLSRHFVRLADTDGRDDPLVEALARTIAVEPALVALLAEAPPTQRLPVLLLAAIHDRVLSRAGEVHPLAAYYPSVGGRRAPDAALAAALIDFVRQEEREIRSIVRARATQTNEIGRCAVLRPALQALAKQLKPAGGGGPLRLGVFDFGCSAGLNLGVDAYGYDDGLTVTPGGEGAPLIRSEWRGAAPVELLGEREWTVVERRGVDLAPIDPADESAARWLRACIWPSDTMRADRLDKALAMARKRPSTLVRSGDGLAALADWLDEMPADVQPVLINSWVLAYFDESAWRSHLTRVETLVRDRGVAWISGEIGKLSPLPSLPDAPEGESPRHTTLWTLQWRAAEGVRTEALAWSHPHGRWIEWLG